MGRVLCKHCAEYEISDVDEKVLAVANVEIERLEEENRRHIRLVQQFQQEGADARRWMEKAYKAIGGGQIYAAREGEKNA